MAGKDSEDEKLTQAIAEVEQKDLKVISKAEYEHLMGLLVAKEKAPSATSEHLTSTPGASFTSKNAQVCLHKDFKLLHLSLLYLDCNLGVLLTL
ncbi:MAG: hypothetical protein JAY75_21940 [Candidatus Thiodiazotropha taylori]|nr:hypothetical protein [Candidatus Thiodiazotropha taylori]MCW4310882.1 hypothetical protein [Candidatus Thiodiazotropha endolucinida]